MKNFQTILQQKGYYKGSIDGIIGKMSLEAAKNFIDDEMNIRGWIKPVNDLVWIRTNQTFNNQYTDYVVRFQNRNADMVMQCSTKAGDFYVFNPITTGGITGCAVACEQQTIASHKFITSANWKSLWLGAPYFMQVGAIQIFRDANKDRNINKEVRTKGWYGINFHRGGLGSIIDQWSAGCMIVADKQWFEAIKIFQSNQLINFTLIELK